MDVNYPGSLAQRRRLPNLSLKHTNATVSANSVMKMIKNIILFISKTH